MLYDLTIVAEKKKSPLNRNSDMLARNHNHVLGIFARIKWLVSVCITFAKVYDGFVE